MTLILPVGIPGCGKSTLGESLSGNGVISAASIVSPDTFREWMTGDRNDQTLNQQAWQAATLVASARLKHNLSVYLDATNVDPSWSEDLRGVAEQCGQRVAIILFSNIGEAIERNAVRARPVPLDVMAHMITKLDQFVVPCGVPVFHHDDLLLLDNLYDWIHA